MFNNPLITHRYTAYQGVPPPPPPPGASSCFGLETIEFSRVLFLSCMSNQASSVRSIYLPPLKYRNFSIFMIEVCKKNRIHHGWSVEIGKSQPEGPSVPVGNEARRVSHRNGGPEGWDFPFSTDHP